MRFYIGVITTLWKYGYGYHDRSNNFNAPSMGYTDGDGLLRAVDESRQFQCKILLRNQEWRQHIALWCCLGKTPAFLVLRCEWSATFVGTRMNYFPAHSKFSSSNDDAVARRGTNYSGLIYIIGDSEIQSLSVGDIFIFYTSHIVSAPWDCRYTLYCLGFVKHSWRLR